jgi:hypothetical protein
MRVFIFINKKKKHVRWEISDNKYHIVMEFLDGKFGKTVTSVTPKDAKALSYLENDIPGKQMVNINNDEIVFGTTRISPTRINRHTGIYRAGRDIAACTPLTQGF